MYLQKCPEAILNSVTMQNNCCFLTSWGQKEQVSKFPWRNELNNNNVTEQSVDQAHKDCVELPAI